ncbi:hypothetical protein B0H16DRAFT_1469499 [Mycena metata]|uniref:Uncharacterized protein n=1 Tax=Mycena metata TaxID=1033252 RepID=A0AAD7MSU9_9AGAR|nr:hypothetical protein B0H16DRAFT_1469499 [Mycena metata]
MDDSTSSEEMPDLFSVSSESASDASSHSNWSSGAEGDDEDSDGTAGSDDDTTRPPFLRRWIRKEIMEMYEHRYEEPRDTLPRGPSFLHHVLMKLTLFSVKWWAAVFRSHRSLIGTQTEARFSVLHMPQGIRIFHPVHNIFQVWDGLGMGLSLEEFTHYKLDVLTPCGEYKAGFDPTSDLRKYFSTSKLPQLK